MKYLLSMIVITLVITVILACKNTVKNCNRDGLEILVFRGCYKDENCSSSSSPIICEINDAIKLARNNQTNTIRMCGSCDGDSAHRINETTIKGLSFIVNLTKCQQEVKHFTYNPNILFVNNNMNIEDSCFENVSINTEETNSKIVPITSSLENSLNIDAQPIWLDVHQQSNPIETTSKRRISLNNVTILDSLFSISSVEKLDITNCTFLTHTNNRNNTSKKTSDLLTFDIGNSSNFQPLMSIKNVGNKVTITDSWFYAQHVRISRSSSVQIIGTNFSGAENGALNIEQSVVNVMSCNFSDNNNFNPNSLGGGAIYVEGHDSKVNVNHSNFVNNSADRAGGTFYLRSGTLNVSHSSISGPINFSVVGDIIYCVFVDNATHLHLDSVNIKINKNITGNNHVIYCISVQDESDKDVTPDIFVNNHMKLSCPKNHKVSREVIPNAKNMKTLIVSCVECKSKYNLQESNIQWNQTHRDFTTEFTDCKSCPWGMVCAEGRVVSKNNYWGYHKSDNKLGFILCPPHYCCSKFIKTCDSYNTCGTNRTGKICGNCSKDNALSFFGHDCIYCSDDDISKNILIFVVLLLLGGLVFLLVILYLKEILTLFKQTCVGKIQSTLKKHRSRQYLSVESSQQKGNHEDEMLRNEYRTDSSNKRVTKDNRIGRIEEDDSQADSGQPANHHLFSQSNENTNNNTKSKNDRINIDRDMSSGIVKIIFFFYQVASIIRVNASSKTKVLDKYKTALFVPEILTSIFNLKLEFQSKIKIPFCISKTASVKEAVKVSYIILVVTLIPVFAIVYKLRRLYVMKSYKKTSHRQQYQEIRDGNDQEIFSPPFPDNTQHGDVDNEIITIKTVPFEGDEIDSTISTFKNLPFSVRLMGGFLQVTLIGFSSVSTTAITMVNCVKLKIENKSKYLLYIDGNVECFQGNNKYQYSILLFIFVWVFPFGLSLYFGCRLLRNCRIYAWQFLVILCFPPSCLWFLCRHRNLRAKMMKYDAMTSRYLLTIVNEPFRERKKTGKKIIWEPVLILRRLLLVIPSIFIRSPVLRMYPLGILLVIYAAHHLQIKPFKLRLLNNIEYFSLTLLWILTMVNMFWANTIESLDIEGNPALSKFALFLIGFEVFILTLPFSVMFIIFTYRLFRYRICKKKET